MNNIEFRVQGNNSDAVARELANEIEVKFGVKAAIQPRPPAPPSAGERLDPIHVTIFIVEVGIGSWHLYDTFFRAPSEREREKLVAKWGEIKQWAKGKLPTTVLAVIGGQALRLHESDPDDLHHRTEQALK